MVHALQSPTHRHHQRIGSGAAFGTTVIVAHASPLVREGLVSTLRRHRRCAVRVWDDGPIQAPRHGEGRRVFIADRGRVEQILALHAEDTHPGIRIVLLTTGRDLDDTTGRIPEDIRRLSVDCCEDELLTVVSDTSEAAVMSLGESPRGGLAPYVQRRVCEYIDRHLAERVALTDLSDVAGLSPCHFARAFKQSFGLSPLRYLSRCRIERAAMLLDASQRNLCEIAQDVGFWDQSHFSRAFNEIHGMAPGAYRRRDR